MLICSRMGNNSIYCYIYLYPIRGSQIMRSLTRSVPLCCQSEWIVHLGMDTSLLHPCISAGFYLLHSILLLHPPNVIPALAHSGACTRCGSGSQYSLINHANSYIYCPWLQICAIGDPSQIRPWHAHRRWTIHSRVQTSKCYWMICHKLIHSTHRHAAASCFDCWHCVWGQ